MKVEIRGEPFNPWHEIENHQSALQKSGQCGATAIFVGTMREFNEGAQVREMVLEHYPGMTEKHLEAICKEAGKKWEILDVLVLHRTGHINVGDPIVLVAVWSAHRAAAFEACRFVIEDLKSRAPFWKQEILQKGKRWVTRNTPG